MVSILRCWCQPPAAPTRPKASSASGGRVTLDWWQLVHEGTSEVTTSATEAAVDGATSIAAAMGRDVAASEARWRRITAITSPPTHYLVRLTRGPARVVGTLDSPTCTVTLGDLPPLPISLELQEASLPKGDDEMHLKKTMHVECPVIGWTAGVLVQIRASSANGVGPWSPESHPLDSTPATE